MPRYEYRIMSGDRLPNEANLNELGKQGWKLVTIVNGGEQPGFSRLPGEVILYLVREQDGAECENHTKQ